MFSIITACFNGASLLKLTINSIINQDYSDYEYIIIDGGSTDGSIQIIKENARFIDYWVSEPDQGIYDAMNKGIDFSRGNYLFFLNVGDELFDRRVLSELAAQIHKEVFPEIIFGNVALLQRGSGTEFIQSREYCDVVSLFFKPINHQSVFASRKTLESKFNLNFKMLADYDWLMSQITKEDVHILYVDRIVSRYDLQGFSSSNSEILKPELLAVRQLYFKHVFVYLLASIKGTKLMYILRIDFIRGWLNRHILKRNINRDFVANV